MSVPLSSADPSQSDAGGALSEWEQQGSTTSPVPRTHSPESPTAEAAASESPPPVEPQSDSELLSAFVQRRDADAFTEIVQRYRLLVYRVALRAVDDRHLADDVFQATFLVLAQSAGKIKRTEALAAWLHGTARNIARRALGNQYTEQKQLTDWAKQTLAQKGEEMATSTEADPFEELARRNEQQLLDEELQQLPEASRAPLVLFYLEKKSQAEIAQIMGLSVEAVEGRLKRAKQELRTRLIRRGVLLSTVVAAATVLTPSITFAAPAASLVSATVTTALGKAALGSTALGATAVTGVATSSQLAAGSASASTLAAQEIALMSVTSKATAMLITTAASTTLISGLVLGAMVGTFTMGSGGSAPSDELSLTELAIPQEIDSEAWGPNLLSPEVDDLVQIALVEPEETKESEKPASAPAEKVDENPSELKAVAYVVRGLSADDLQDADEYAQSIGLTVDLHLTSQTFVVRATSENHRKLSDYLSAIRQKRDAKASVQFELFSARAKLAKLLKELDENHPDVKQARNEIATIEKSIADQTQGAMPTEKVKSDLEQSTAPVEKVDENPNELNPFVYQVGDLTADDLQGAEDFAQSLGFSVLERRSKNFVVVNATTENHRKLADHFRQIRRNRDAKSSLQFELLSARYQLAMLLKEFDENHPDVKQARNKIAAIEKSIAARTQGAKKSEKIKNDSEQSTAQTVTSDLSDRPVSTSFDVGDLSAEELLAVGEYAMSVADLREVRTSSQCLIVLGTLDEVHKISKYIEELRNKRPSQVRDRFKPLEDRLKLAKQLKRFEENHPDIKQARDEIASMQKSIEEGTQNPLVVDDQVSTGADATPEVIYPAFSDVVEIKELETTIQLSPPFIAELKFPERITKVDAFNEKYMSVRPISPKELGIELLTARQDQMLVTGESGKTYRIYVRSEAPKDPTSQLNALNVQVRQQGRRIGELQNQLKELHDRGIDPPKGVITVIDRTTRTVWLNVGKVDNLKTQITFAITDKDIQKEIPFLDDLKARIEVVEVNQTSSIARIVEEDQKRPIQVGDSIFSPVWSMGKKRRIAVVGNDDLNGDMQFNDEDRRMFHNLIENAGGEIALEVNDEGVRIPSDAQLAPDTAWVVVGRIDRARANKSLVESQRNKLLGQAGKQGLRIVLLTDFLAYMGWKPVIPHIEGFLPSAISLQLGQKRLLTGSNFQLRDLVGVVSDRPDVVQVVDKTTLRAIQDGMANITVTDVDGKTAHVEVNVPRQYIRSVSLQRKLTPGEKSIYEVLCRQEQLEFPQQTLEQFADSLSAKYQIPVKVDCPALEAAGVAKSATVSFSGLKRVEHALTDILSDVGGQRLEFYVDNGELHFTTQEAMRTTNRVREYDLSSLGEGHLNYDLPFPGDGELDFALQYADSLSQEITRQGKVLSFNAPLSNHKKFERFLAMLPELLK